MMVLSTNYMLQYDMKSKRAHTDEKTKQKKGTGAIATLSATSDTDSQVEENTVIEVPYKTVESLISNTRTELHKESLYQY